MNDIESACLDGLLQRYPHLEEKAVVDFINGLSVMSDHIDVKSKTSAKGFSARFFDRVTGRGRKRQELIDTSVETSFVFIKDYLVNNEVRLARNEVFLQQVMDGVALVSAKLQEIAGDTSRLRDNVQALADRLSVMEHFLAHKIDGLELHNRAMAEKSLALSIFESCDDLFTPEQSLWMLLTRLKFGDFGLWVASRDKDPTHGKTVETVLQSLKMDCIRILSAKNGRGPDELVDRKTLFTTLNATDEMLREALCLVSDNQSSELESVIMAVNSDSVPEIEAEMPFIFSNVSIVEEMSCLLSSRGAHVAIN